MQELGRMIKKLCSTLFNRVVITVVLILIQAYWFWSLLTTLSSYAHWLNPLMLCLSVIMCAVLIRQDSTAPEFKISWMILFMIMPVQGGLLYLLWGDKRPAIGLRRRMERAEAELAPLRTGDEAARAARSTASLWKASSSAWAKCGARSTKFCGRKRRPAWTFVLFTMMPAA